MVTTEVSTLLKKRQKIYRLVEWHIPWMTLVVFALPKQVSNTEEKKTGKISLYKKKADQTNYQCGPTRGGSPDV